MIYTYDIIYFIKCVLCVYSVIYLYFLIFLMNVIKNLIFFILINFKKTTLTTLFYSPTSKIIATPARIHRADDAFVFNCAINTNVGPLNCVV